jgi:rod shape determining protein RodA
LNEENNKYQLWQKIHVDLPLLFAIIALIAFSMVVLYSASGQHADMLFNKLVHTTLAFSVMLVMAQFSPGFYARWAPPAFLVCIILLLCVMVFGHIGKGAQRWLDLGFIKFQPSEFLKIVMPMTVAAFMDRHPLPPRLVHVAIALTLVLIPTLLIAEQPDLGTAILVAVSGIFVIFLAGINWWLIIAAGILLCAFMPVMWFFLMHDYQRQRVLTFLNPESDPLGTGYHIIQSKIAIGSGGLFGKGWLNGTQSQLDFIPERHTDFIFAVIGEEFGLMGFLVLMLLYLLILYRCLHISLQAQNSFDRLLGGALSLTFFFYVFINIGMVSGILPVVGVPLPLVSYGGTAMITLCAGFGILMSIHTHRRLLA